MGQYVLYSFAGLFFPFFYRQAQAQSQVRRSGFSLVRCSEKMKDCAPFQG